MTSDLYRTLSSLLIWLSHIMSHVVEFVKLMFFIIFKGYPIKTRILYNKIRVLRLFIVYFSYFNFKVTSIYCEINST